MRLFVTQRGSSGAFDADVGLGAGCLSRKPDKVRYGNVTREISAVLSSSLEDTEQ